MKIPIDTILVLIVCIMIMFISGFYVVFTGLGIGGRIFWILLFLADSFMFGIILKGAIENNN